MEDRNEVREREREQAKGGKEGKLGWGEARG